MLDKKSDIAAKLSANDITVGQTVSFTVTIDRILIDAFTNLSGDWNPLHNDNAFAQARGYKKRVAHGAIQQALISRLIGMYVPGENSIIKKINTSYSGVVIEGDTLLVKGVVAQWDSRAAEGRLDITIKNAHDSKSVSFTVVYVGMTSLGDIKSPPQSLRNKPIAVNSQSGRPYIFCLGGSSALCQSLISTWNSPEFTFVTVGRNPETCELVCDLKDPSDFRFQEYLLEHQPYGIIHFASYAPSKSSMVQFDIDLFLRSLSLQITPVQTCARLAAEKKLINLRRIVLIGSTWARHLFAEKGYEGYSYTKTISKYFAQDLARELATHSVTVNTIAPAELSLGMNAGLSERTKAILSAKNPTGRMVTAEDVMGPMRFLLSSQSASMTGHEFIVAGGR